MYPFSTSFAVFLLLVLTQLITGVQVKSLSHDRKSLGDVITNLLRVPWINLNSDWAEEVSPTCRDDISTLFESADAGEMWALQMLDASSKIPAGYLMGNIVDLGMYDQCVRVKGHQNPANIQGQHCMASMSMPPKYVKNATAMLYVQQLSAYNPSASVDLSFTASLCLPSSCSVDDVTGLVNASLRISSELTDFEVKVVKVSCTDVNAFDEFALWKILTILFLVVLAAFLIFCTGCELVAKQRPDNASLALKSLAEFSLYSNTLKLWSTDVPDGTITALHGIRFLSMCVVIIGHCLLIPMINPKVNQEVLSEWKKTCAAIVAVIGAFSVDNFLILSSVLSTHTFMKKMRTGARFIIPEMFFHRYIRLIPCLAAAILLTVFIGSSFDYGPLWQNMKPLAIDACKKNWWSNLLFVQNLINREEICLGHTWYLATDMQLFVISPLILYPLFYRPKIGLSILGIFSIGGLILPIIQILKHEYPFFFHGNRTFSETWIDFYNFYTVTYNRTLPYFIGILLGYYLLNVKRELTKAQAAFLWVLTLLAGSFFVLSSPYVQPNSHVFNLGWEVTYASFGRLLWSLTTAWIIYACIRGHGGPIARFCSLPIFVPLSRLSYGIHLSSACIQTARAAMVHTAEFHTLFDTFYLFGSDTMASIVVAFCLNVCFERPAMTLEKFIRTKRRSRIIEPASTRIEEKLPPSVAKYFDVAKYRVGSQSISSRMLQLDFWQNVAELLNTLGERTSKSPAELAKTWQGWESAFLRKQSQRNTHENGDGNRHVDGAHNRCSQLQMETIELEERLLSFLVVVTSGGHNRNERMKES